MSIQEVYDIHPIAKCYPKITGSDFTELRKSIRTQGLLNPIVLFEGQILDGSNRYRACMAEDITPTFKQLPAGIDPFLYVIAQNESRRHLSVEQRAHIGAKLAKLRAGGDRRSPDFRTSADGSTEAVAKKLKVSSKSIERARRVQKKGAPEVVEASEQGEVNLSQAERIAALPKEQQAPVLAVVKSQKAALQKAKDFRQSDEFKARVSKHQAIIDAPSIYPIDLVAPTELAAKIKDLRADEKQIGSLEADELGRTTKSADELSKEASLDKRYVAWANSVKRKLAARILILEEAKEFKKELKAEKPKTLATPKKVPAIDRQWQVFVPQFKALLKLFSNKDDRVEIRRRIDGLLEEAGWPLIPDGGVVLS
jgi:hypothetical protein